MDDIENKEILRVTACVKATFHTMMDVEPRIQRQLEHLVPGSEFRSKSRILSFSIWGRYVLAVVAEQLRYLPEAPQVVVAYTKIRLLYRTVVETNGV
jgi:hypothetical protein